MAQDAPRPGRVRRPGARGLRGRLFGRRSSGERGGVRRGSPQWRLRVGFLVIAFVLSIFAARLVQLQAVDPKEYAAAATAAGAVEVVLPAQRGDILDRNGRPLAESTSGSMILADPTLTVDKAGEIATFLTKELGVDYSDTLALLERDETRFQYVARQIPSTIADDLLARAEAKGFEGLWSERDPVRDYPVGDVGANIVGFLGTDPVEGSQPLAGLELTFNDWLSGKDGVARWQSGMGYKIPLGDSTTVEPVDGKDLTTTLDLDLQWYVQRALRQAVEDSGSVSGVAIVMDSRTGDVLAQADYPTYDATNPLASPKEDLGSRAISDVYEPGSVSKAFTVASLLDAGKVTKRTKIVVPPELHRQDRTIGDWFDHPEIRLTMAGVIAKSSNIGTVLAADTMGKQQFRDYLSAFGLGTKTDAGIRGETAGLLPSGALLNSQTKDRMTFGQSLSVNALQMTAAFNTIANGGEYVAPSIIAGEAKADSGSAFGTDLAGTHRVVSEEAAQDTTAILERVIDPEAGVAPRAAVEGYRVAGKTGTSQRVGPECACYDGTFSMSFAGFAPADDPRFTVYVVLHAPTEEGGGGSMAGPVFSKIMSFALRRYQVPPTGTKPSQVPVEWGPDAAEPEQP